MRRRKPPIHLESVREAHRMLDVVAADLDDLTPAMLGHAHRKLDALAREHPELTAPRGRDRERQERMANEKQVSFRLPSELVDRIDAAAARMKDETPGLNVTRADVVRLLLTRGITTLEGNGSRKSSQRHSTGRR